MRQQKLHAAVTIAALALHGTASAAGDAPAPPPGPPAERPPPMAPPPGVAGAEPGPPPIPGGFPGVRGYARRPRVGPDGAVEMRYEPVEGPTTLLILTHETPVVHWGYYHHGWWGPRQSFVRSYTPVCEGPCAERFVPGVYDLALAKDGRVAVPERPVVIRGPSLVRGQYVDHSGLRVGGIALAVGGIIAGTVMMVVAVHRSELCSADGFCYYENEVNGPLLAGGIVLAIGSGIAGSIMAWQRDEARFSVLPLHVSSLYPREGGVARALPEGAMVRLRF